MWKKFEDNNTVGTGVGGFYKKKTYIACKFLLTLYVYLGWLLCI